jgi:hypothetical protein
MSCGLDNDDAQVYTLESLSLESFSFEVGFRDIARDYQDASRYIEWSEEDIL